MPRSGTRLDCVSYHNGIDGVQSASYGEPSAQRDWQSPRLHELMNPPPTSSGRTSAATSRHHLALVALGIVFGDIATSPLYAVKECFSGPYGIAATQPEVLGVLSLMVWANMASWKLLTSCTSWRSPAMPGATSRQPTPVFSSATTITPQPFIRPIRNGGPACSAGSSAIPNRPPPSSPCPPHRRLRSAAGLISDSYRPPDYELK